MSEIRHLPEEKERVETGPVQFGEDWPGLFIRGDNAFGYALALHIVLQHVNMDTVDYIQYMQVKSLMNDLQSCNVNPNFKGFEAAGL